jgi:hypothetical protein
MDINMNIDTIFNNDFITNNKILILIQMITLFLFIINLFFFSVNFFTKKKEETPKNIFEFKLSFPLQLPENLLNNPILKFIVGDNLDKLPLHY